MMITPKLPDRLILLKSVLAGGQPSKVRFGYPEMARYGFGGRLSYMLGISLNFPSSVRVDCKPKEPVFWTVEAGFGQACELDNSTKKIVDLTQLMKMLHIKAMQNNPFAIKLAKGVLEIDCTITDPAAPDGPVEHLLIRVTQDLIKDQDPSTTLLIKLNPLSPLMFANFNRGRLGSPLEQAIAALTSDLDCKANLLLYGTDGQTVLPIIGWTDRLDLLATNAIGSFVRSQLVPGPSRFDDYGLQNFLRNGLGPLTLEEPLFKKEVELVKLS